jgi:hypothetical protein
LEPEINQGVERFIPSKINATPIPTITAVWSTQLNIFFTAETKTTITPFTGVHPDRCFVYKSHNGFTLTRITDKKKPCQ